ncbi:MAG TPA: YihY/virulence factor BrkB family protein, partial [Melioribacteraceae bacterium]|nr:YihY/virulence factor BrkB family protein [Melioribacteraceae bacterium]
MTKYKFLKFIVKYIKAVNFKRFLEFLKHYFGGLYKRIDAHDWFLWGGGLAFSIFLCIIPFILILFAILGNILDSSSVTEQITHLIDTAVPYKEYSDYAKKIILSRVQEVVEFKTTAAYIGGIGLFFAASGLFSAMRTVLNSIYGYEKEKSVLIAKLRDFGMVLLLIVFIFLLTFVLPILRFVIDLADKIPVLDFLRLGSWLNTVFSITSLVLIFSLFYLFYYIVPYTKVGKSVAAVSAFWATFLWDMARRLFG